MRELSVCVRPDSYLDRSADHDERASWSSDLLDREAFDGSVEVALVQA